MAALIQVGHLIGIRQELARGLIETFTLFKQKHVFMSKPPKPSSLAFKYDRPALILNSSITKTELILKQSLKQDFFHGFIHFCMVPVV